MKSFEIRPLAKEKMFKVVFLFSILALGPFCSAEQNFLAILVKGHKRNTSVKLL